MTQNDFNDFNDFDINDDTFNNDRIFSLTEIINEDFQ